MSDFDDELAKRLAEQQGGAEADSHEHDAPAADPAEPTAAELLGIEDDADDDSDDIEIDLGDDEDASATADQVAIDLGVADEAQEPEEVTEVDLDFGDVDDAESHVLVDEASDEESEGDTGDEALEKALEELRSELRSKPGDWYVIHTYSGMEKRVKQNLESRVTSLNMEDYIFEVRVPTEEVTEIRNGNKKTVTRTVLPGYVLVCMDLTDESWSTVRHTPSVTGFVGHATTPVPLGLDEVEKMLAPAIVAQVNAASQGQSKPSRKKKIEVADFNVGDSVMVTDGPFSGVHASITEINVNSQRIKALVEILGRETPVDLTFSQIQKV